MAEQLKTAICDRKPKHDKLLVAAIDFGTTCTGYAYSLKQDYEKDPLNIGTKQSWKGNADIGLQAPTSILFKPDKTFHSFGFEAEEEYKKLAFNKQNGDWYFFRHFKMILHHIKSLTRETDLEADNQKLMNALFVFTEAIKAVVDHLYKTITIEHGNGVQKSEIRWVLTVPAIWSDSAKMFMRDAAQRAGINGDQLLLALEPEAASIYCKEQAIRKVDKGGGAILRRFDPGEQYMVLDLGGGTVDVTVNEVCTDGNLKEVYAASGGPWGGTTVNQAFRKSIEDTVGKELFVECISNNKHGWILLEKEFEEEKRKFYPSDTAEYELHLPNYLTQKPNLNLAAKFNEKHGNALEVKENFLVMRSSKMEEYFDVAIKKIIDHISSLLQRKELRKLSSIMLVGGFAESMHVKDQIAKTFHTKTVFVPPEAGVSVLKGAVMFGHNPNIITERICPWTYGVHTRKAFNKNFHDIKRRVTIGGKECVNNVFIKYLEIGESMMVGTSSRGRVFNLINPRDSRIFWNVYKSRKTDPTYCDEEGVDRLGSLVIELPRRLGDIKWRLELKMTCRGTELEASVNDADTHEPFKNKARFDFLRSGDEEGSDFIQD